MTGQLVDGGTVTGRRANCGNTPRVHTLPLPPEYGLWREVPVVLRGRVVMLAGAHQALMCRRGRDDAVAVTRSGEAVAARCP
jgi:hypothetical protein